MLLTALRKGTRKLLKALGYHLPGKRRGLGEQAKKLVATYVDQDQRASFDWSDPQQRKEHLQTLVQDVEATLALATEQMDDEEVRAIGWLLTKILGDDVEQDDSGSVQIAKGSAEDRIMSVTDPEMRHGRKSASKRFAGFKASVSTEQSSALIMDIEDMPANDRDGQELMPTIERVEQHSGVTVERVISDGAYLSGDNPAACAEYPAHPIDLLGPLNRPADPEVAKFAFHIDDEAKVGNFGAGSSGVSSVRHIYTIFTNVVPQVCYNVITISFLFSNVEGPVCRHWPFALHMFYDNALCRRDASGRALRAGRFSGARPSRELVTGSGRLEFHGLIPNWSLGVPPDGLDGFSGLLNWHLVCILGLAARLEEWAGERLSDQRWQGWQDVLATASRAVFWDEQHCIPFLPVC